MKKKRLLFGLAAFLMLFGLQGWGQIISQYVETNSGSIPKGIEIWNNTAAALDFSTNNLIILQGTNGGVLTNLTNITTGTLATGEVLVIGTSDIGTYLTGQGLTGVTYISYTFTFNGDDALAVTYGGVTTDVFGTPGVDPGTAWIGNLVSTANQNIALLNGITTGDLDGWTDPSERFQTVSTTPATLPEGLVGFGIAPIAGGTTIVQYTSSAANIFEDAGTYDLTLSITNEDATNATTCDVVLTSGSNLDVGNYTTQTVTFPAGSSANQTVTVTITDDGDNEGEETLTFSIQNVAGGNSATAGTPGEFDLTIQDNDFPGATLPSSEDFEDCITQPWTAVSVASNRNWVCGSGYQSINGFSGDVASNDYLISPIFNLDNSSNELLSFESWNQFTDVTYPPIEILFTTNYSGDPSTTTWNALTATWSPQNSQTWTSSGYIDISLISGTEVQFAFHYISSGTGSGTTSTWRIDNISIEEAPFLPEPSNHVTDFTATANASSQITVNWTDATAGAGEQLPNAYLVKATIDPSTPTAPVDGTPEADGALVYNVAYGVETAIFTGLDASTTYNFAIWPYTNLGVNVDYKTDGTVPEASATTPAPPPVATVFINEVDADITGTDAAEFIELFDGGTGNTDLSGLVVVLFNGGNDLSYSAIDLDGYSTDASGFFVIGSSSVPNVDYVYFTTDGIQNGADAIAVYEGNATDFPNGTAVTVTNLIDALVYETGDPDDAGLLVLLNPGEPQVDENVYFNGIIHSMQRITDGNGGLRNTSMYDMLTPTPGTANLPLTFTWDGGGDNSSWNDAANWSSDLVPRKTTNASIPSGRAAVIIAADQTADCFNLTLEGSLTIQSNATGTGSLIVHGTATGNVTIQQYIGGYNESPSDGWHLLSSPVGTFNIQGSSFEPGANDDFYAWSEAENLWKNYKAGYPTQIEPGRGYLVAYQETSTKTFSGVLNTGDIAVTGLTNSAYNGWNLVGNPFSSAIVWDDGSWDLTNLQVTAKIRNESAGNYMDVISGGTDIIPANQGFFVQANVNTSLTIPAASKMHDSQPFYKNAVITEGLLQLKAEATATPFYDIQTIRLHQESDENYDRYDSEKFFGNEDAPQMYSIAGDLGNLSTHSVNPSSINEKRIFALGFEAVSGSYKLSLESNTLGDSYAILLEDLKTGEIRELGVQSACSFESDGGDPVHRFNLHLVNTAFGIWEDSGLEGVHVYSYDRNLYVSTQMELTGATVTVYNILGQVIHSQGMAGGHETVLIARPGAYIVRVQAEEGISITKVIIQ